MSFTIETASREGAKPIIDKVSHARLTSVLDYDPETGIFVWKRRLSNRVSIGDVAGTPSSEGYTRISIDGRIYLAHRLAWIYMTGESAKGDIDHKDTNPANNAFDNLRDCSRAQNLANQGARTNNSTGIKGVYFCERIKGANKWEAKIMSRGKRINGGRHPSKELAIAAANQLRATHHGEFSRER